MKLNYSHLSTNVERQCLGKTVSVDSPEDAAALACQAEVNSLREQAVSNLTANWLLAKGLNTNSRMSLENAETIQGAGNMMFDLVLDQYETFASERRSTAASGLPFLTPIIEGADTFQSRLREFSDVLHLQNAYPEIKKR